MKNLARTDNRTHRPLAKSKKRGQTLVELSLTLPILMILLSIVVEGGLALNAWLRVNTAARDAVRFAMDSGRPSETGNLVVDKLAGIDFGSGKTMGSRALDVWLVIGSTDSNGQINAWNVSHVYDGDSNGNSGTVTQAMIQARLNSQGLTVSRGVNIFVTEVDYVYTPVIGTLLAGGANIPMKSYAMVQERP